MPLRPGWQALSDDELNAEVNKILVMLQDDTLEEADEIVLESELRDIGYELWQRFEQEGQHDEGQ